jgi:hypothetical protein
LGQKEFVNKTDKPFLRFIKKTHCAGNITYVVSVTWTMSASTGSAATTRPWFSLGGTGKSIGDASRINVLSACGKLLSVSRYGWKKA